MKPPAGDGDQEHHRERDPDRDGKRDRPGPPREAELISFPRSAARSGRGTDHLIANRSLIVRRSLLATAVGGVMPIPVMDDYLAGRVRAGMLMQLSDRRKVDLAPSAAELLADPREGTAARNATMTAATLLALKLAWRKFFVVLGAGRRAEEMATSFQVGTLFDHFCAETHVGAGVDRPGALRIRAAVFASIRESERAALVAIFQEGGRVLGRTIGEAPAWVSRQLQHAVERYVASGGNPDVAPFSPPPRPEGRVDEGRIDEGGFDESQVGSRGVDPAFDGTPADFRGLAPDARWLDRAAALIEQRLSGLGNGYLESLLSRFDSHLARQAATGPESPSK